MQAGDQSVRTGNLLQKLPCFFAGKNYRKVLQAFGSDDIFKPFQFPVQNFLVK